MTKQIFESADLPPELAEEFFPKSQKDFLRPPPHKELQIDLVRELEEGDLKALSAARGTIPLGQTLRAELRSSHHRLAQLIAQGRYSREEVALMSGYGVIYIDRIQKDPAFKALVSHYINITEIKFRDIIDQMAEVGRDAVEEIQRRMAERPEEFSIRELNETIELMVVRGREAAGARSAGGSPPTIQISFRTPNPAPAKPLVIEGD